MKTYHVELVVFEDGETNPEVMNLVNIEDPSDVIMAAPDEFINGEIVKENEFYLDEAMMVDDYSYGNGTFAFKKIIEFSPQDRLINIS
jgi:hypothetical protein